MELEKFQFQGTFDKIQFIAPLSKGKRIKIKIYKTNVEHQQREARVARSRERLDKKNAVAGQENDV